jgi:hypothetical protein
MNIFKILSSCYGSISETNISAMLVYLLDPSNDHGFGNRFLNRTVGQLGCQDLKNNQKLKKYLENPSDYEIKIQAEFPVDVKETESGKSNRRIDILLEFYKRSNESESPEFAIAIENKIYRDSLSDPDQIRDEILGLKKNYENSDTELHCILISPACPKVEESLNKIVNYNKVHLSWKEREVSIVKILNEMLDEEAEGTIDPLSTETKYIVRSFIAFINNDFQSDDIKEEESRERTDYGKYIREYLRDIYDEMDPDKEYSVEERKEELSKIIKEKSGKPLNDNTRERQFYKVTVNCPYRGDHNIRKPLDERFNLFYYSDDSKKKIKKFSEDMSEDVDIWWSQDGKKVSKKLSVLREQKKNGNL